MKIQYIWQKVLPMTSEVTGLGTRPVLQESEIRQRHERTRALLQEKEVDALFLTDESNLLYFTGTLTPAGGLDGFEKYAPFAIIIPRKGAVTAVVPRGWECVLAHRPTVENVVVVSGRPGDYRELDALLSTFRTLGVEMGVEQRMSFPAAWLAGLGKKVRLVDSEPITSEIRAIKSGYEVTCIREACRATGHAFKEAYGRIREGLTERDIDLVMKQAMLAAGADDVNYANVRIYPGSIQGTRSKTRTTRFGDYVWADVGAVYQGYRTDFSRAVVVGEMDKVRLDMYESIRVSSRRSLEAVRPGMTAADVCAIANAELAKYGFPPKAAGRVGHGMGLDTSEIPSIALNDHTLLRPGMVFTIEPGYMAPHGYYVIESVILVTEDVPQVLSDVVISDKLFGPDGLQLQ
jgi:Xaa-Pro aminopeptidase